MGKVLQMINATFTHYNLNTSLYYFLLNNTISISEKKLQGVSKDKINGLLKNENENELFCFMIFLFETILNSGISSSKLLPPPEIRVFGVNRDKRLTFFSILQGYDDVKQTERSKSTARHNPGSDCAAFALFFLVQSYHSKPRDGACSTPVFPAVFICICITLSDTNALTSIQRSQPPTPKAETFLKPIKQEETPHHGGEPDGSMSTFNKSGLDETGPSVVRHSLPFNSKQTITDSLYSLKDIGSFLECLTSTAARFPHKGRAVRFSNPSPSSSLLLHRLYFLAYVNILGEFMRRDKAEKFSVFHIAYNTNKAFKLYLFSVLTVSITGEK